MEERFSKVESKVSIIKENIERKIDDNIEQKFGKIIEKKIERLEKQMQNVSFNKELIWDLHQEGHR